jgi:hypothetical protein
MNDNRRRFLENRETKSVASGQVKGTVQVDEAWVTAVTRLGIVPA